MPGMHTRQPTLSLSFPRKRESRHPGLSAALLGTPDSRFRGNDDSNWTDSTAKMTLGRPLLGGSF